MFKKLLEKSHSPINGEIVIYKMFGTPRMSIGGLLQSGGIIGDIWKKAAKVVKRKKLDVRNVLILGLGAGTVARVFSKKFPKAKITGVEIDPEVMRLGKKYFGLEEIKNLKIVSKNAFQFANGKFDLIIVDLYLGEKIPGKVQSKKFLKNLKKIQTEAGVIIFNRLFWDEHKKEAEKFVRKIEKMFGKVELVRTVANLLVICK